MLSNRSIAGQLSGISSFARGRKRRQAVLAAAVGTLAAWLPVGESPVQAASDAWSTAPATGNFSGTNWTVGSIVPGAATGTAASNDTLYFGTSSITSLTNNDVNFNFSGIIFNTGANSFNISGNSFTLTGNILNYSGLSQSITAPIVLGASESVYTATGGSTTLSGGISGTGFGLTSFGTGTLYLSGVNTYTGTTTVSGGTVNLNFGSATPVISSSSPLAMAGGTLVVNGFAGTADIQAFSGTAFSSGGSVISLNPNSATSLSLALGTATRTVGGTATFNFVPTTNTISMTSGTGAGVVNGVLPWAAVNNSGSAANLSTAGYTFANISAGSIAPYAAATLTAESGTIGTATTNYDINTTAGTVRGVALTANTIRQVSTAASIFNFSTGSLTTNGLMTAGTGTLTIGGAVGQGTLFVGASTELVLAAETAPIVVNSTLANNGTNASTVTVTGNSTVTLSGNNTFTGDLVINSGTLAAGTGQGGAPTASDLGALQPAANRNIVINSGGTLSLTGGNVLGTGGSSNTLANDTLVVNAGGTFKTGLNGAGAGWWNKVGNVNLNGGTILLGSGANNANFQALALIGNVNVAGTVPSSIISYAATNLSTGGIHLGQNTGAAVVNFTVADVTNDANPDLTITPPLLNTSANLAANGFNKSGAGTMLLTGVSSYTGPTTIIAGTLQLGNGVSGSDGNINGTSGVTNSGTLAYNLNGSVTAGYPIGGTGPLTKAGPGSLTLTTASNYTGNTTVSAGVLALDATGSNTGALSGTAVTVTGSGSSLLSKGNTSIAAPGSGASLALSSGGGADLRDGTINTLSLGGNLSLGNSALSFDLGNSSGSNDQITVGGAVTGSGPTVININALSSLVAGGSTYTLLTSAGGGLSSVAFTLGTKPAGFNTYSLALSTATAEILSVSANAAAGTEYWTGAASSTNGNTANNWGFGASLATPKSNWSTDPSGTIDALQVPSSNTDTYFTATNAVATAGALSTQLDAPYSIKGLYFTTTGTSITSVAINTNTSGNTLTIGTDGLNVIAGNPSAVTINGPGSLVVSGSQTWANNSTQPLTVNAPVTGSDPLTIAGTGLIVLGGSNAYSNSLTVNSGTLQLANSSALTATPLTIAGGTVDLNGFSQTVASLSDGGSSTGVLTDTGATAVLTSSSNSSTNFSGTISGSAALKKSGTGSLTLSGNNSYTGGTTLTAGTLVINSNTAIGSGTFNIAGGTIDNNSSVTLTPNPAQIWSGDFTVAGNNALNLGTGAVTLTASRVVTINGGQPVTVGGSISGTGFNLTKAGSGILVLAGSNNYTGSTILTANDGTVILANPSALAGTATFNFGPTTGNTLDIATDGGDTAFPVNTNSGFSATIQSDRATSGPGITHTLGLATLGGGFFNFTAGPNVTGGSPAVAFNSMLLSSGTGANLILNPTTADVKIAAMNASNTSKTVILDGTSVGNTIGSVSQATGITLSVFKSNSSVWTFTGSANYSGSTIINSGTLAFASTGSAPLTPNFNISGGAVLDVSADPAFALTSAQTLLGTGNVNGLYTHKGGTISPAGTGSTGILTFNSGLNLAGGTLAVELNSGSTDDLLAVTGSLTLGAPTALNATFLNTATVGQTFPIINYTGAFAGSLANLTTPGRAYTVSNTGSSILVTVGTAGAANLNWNSSSSGLFDLQNSFNWFNTGTNQQDAFYIGDNVTFGDQAGLQTAISLVGTLAPTSTTVTSSANNYTFGGTGSLGGSGGLVKNGSSLLTISTSNSYTGGTTINGGTIAISTDANLGAATGAVNMNGGTLESTATGTSARAFNLSGATSTIQVDTAANTYTLTGNLADGASAGTLNKTGAGTLLLSGSIAYTGGTNISAGTLSTNKNLGPAGSTATVQIASGATLSLNGAVLTNTVTGTGSIISTVATISGDESAFAGTFTHNNPFASTGFTTANSTSASAAYVVASDQGSLQGMIATNGGMTLNLGSLTGITNSLFRGSNSGSPGNTVLSIGALGVSTVFSGNIQDGGAVKLGVTKVGSASLTLGGVNAYTQGTTVTSGNLIFASANAFPVNSSLIVASTGLATFATHGTGATFVPQLSTLSNSGKIDLGDNAMVVHTGDIAGITAQVAAGYNSGRWNGSSGSGAINSSIASADTNHLTALGVATNLTTFQGAAVLASDVLVKYTYYGDANLDGHVDGSDYSNIDFAYVNNQTAATPLTGWYNGDFNYDGLINGSDYTLMDNAYNTQGATLASAIASPSAQIAGGSSVPEPTSLTVLALGATGLLGRRNRRRYAR